MGGPAGAPGELGRGALKAKALQWLAQREHSRHELREKLQRWQQRVAGRAGLAGANPDEATGSHPFDGAATADDDTGTAGRARPRLDPTAEKALDGLLDELAAAGLLSDQRFVESRVHARMGRFGNRHIESELRQHGVRPPPEVLERLRATERDRALRVLSTRVRRSGPLGHGPAERQRWQRFLASRGFSADTIAEAIRSLLREAPADD